MLVQLDASGIHLLLHYPDWCAPETVAVTDARGITIYVNASQLGGG